MRWPKGVEVEVYEAEVRWKKCGRKEDAHAWMVNERVERQRVGGEGVNG